MRESALRFSSKPSISPALPQSVRVSPNDASIVDSGVVKVIPTFTSHPGLCAETRLGGGKARRHLLK